MNNIEVAESFVTLVEAQEWNGLQEILADNFTIKSPTTELNKQQIVAYIKTLFTAFPDISFGLTDFEQKDYLVTCTVHQKDTHDGILD